MYSAQPGYGSMSAPTYLQGSSYFNNVAYEVQGQYVLPESRIPEVPEMKFASMFEPEGFLSEERPAADIVYDADGIMSMVKEAFLATTGMDFPEIEVEVCDSKRFLELFALSGGSDATGVQGFAINRFGNGKSRIAILNAPLDSMMLTLGHEIGHCLSPALPDTRDEEAKAMAFSIAWMDAIVKNNIGGLSSSINPRPANNGVHNAAWEFVIQNLEAGMKAIEVFSQMVTGALRIAERPEVHYG